MKTVLLLVHDDPGQEARLRAALDLVRAIDGHLHCLHVTAIPADVAEYALLGGNALLLGDEEQRETEHRARITRRLTAESVMFGWQEATGELAEMIGLGAAFADVIVSNTDLHDSTAPDMRRVAGEITIAVGKPVLAVPKAMTGLALNGRAIIAWDGSDDAEDAVRAAVPLLALARDVEILTVDDGSAAVPAKAVARYLSHHGINARIKIEITLTARPADHILAAVSGEQAEWVVMGAYGHARFLEHLFGGTTRTMLRDSPAPLFLVHHR